MREVAWLVRSGFGWVRSYNLLHYLPLLATMLSLKDWIGYYLSIKFCSLYILKITLWSRGIGLNFVPESNFGLKNWVFQQFCFVRANFTHHFCCERMILKDKWNMDKMVWSTLIFQLEFLFPRSNWTMTEVFLRVLEHNAKRGTIETFDY